MKLIPIATVRTTLGFEDMPDINSAIEAALELVTANLGASLHSDFDLTTRNEKFYVPPHLGPTPQGFMRIELRLGCGFVDRTSLTITAKASPSATSLTPITTMRFKDTVDERRGILTDSETVYGSENYTASYFDRVNTAGPYIDVQYTSGFNADANDVTLFDQTEVPVWLQQAAKVAALVALENHPVITNADIDQDTDMLKKSYNAIIGRYQRYAPSSLLPI